jgi:O-antigen/teichoic acid export membrane protein
VKPHHIVSRARFVKNLLANSSALAVEIVVGFLLTPFIILSLGLTVYGVWSLLNSIVGYFGLADMGIRSSVGRNINLHLARGESHEINATASTAALFLTAVALGLLLVATALGVYFGDVFSRTPAELLDDVRIALPVMVVALWLALYSSIYRNLIEALDRFDVSNAILGGSILMRAAGVVIALSGGYGFLGLVVASTLVQALALTVYAIIGRRLHPDFRIRPRLWSALRFKELWKFGIAAFLARGASQLIYQADQIIVMALFGPTLVGVYSIATALVSYAQKFVSQVGSTLFPSIIKAAGLRDFEGLKALFFALARHQFFLGTLIYTGLIIFGQEFIELWIGHGDEMRISANILAILAAAEIAAMFGSSSGASLFGLGEVSVYVAASLAEAISNVALSIALASLTAAGLYGVALGTLIAALGVRAIFVPWYAASRFGFSYRRYAVRFGGRVALLLLASAATFAGVQTHGVDGSWLVFIVQVAIATLIYVPLGLLLLYPRTQLAELRERLVSSRR